MGYVYILSNEAMPGLLKIGFTARTPEQRALDLYTTGTPAPFTVEFAIELVGNTYQLEQSIHQRLSSFRLDQRREFFRIDLKDAIQQIAYFIIEEKHVVITLQGNNSDPFIKTHELAHLWQKIVVTAKENRQRLDEVKRIAELTRRYNEWHKEHSCITLDDIAMSAMITMFSTIGWLSGFGAGSLAERLNIIPPHNSTTHHDLENIIIIFGFLSAIPVVLYFYVRDKRKSNWGKTPPDEFKEVASKS